MLIWDVGCHAHSLTKVHKLFHYLHITNIADTPVWAHEPDDVCHIWFSATTSIVFPEGRVPLAQLDVGSTIVLGSRDVLYLERTSCARLEVKKNTGTATLKNKIKLGEPRVTVHVVTTQVSRLAKI